MIRDAEAVVEPALPAPLGQPGGLRARASREAGAQRARQHAVPGAGREADAELLEHLAAEAAALEVGARAAPPRPSPTGSGA